MKIHINKKSSILSPEALVRIIGAVLVFLLIIFPACDKLYHYLRGQEYLKSFENLADGINKIFAEAEKYIGKSQDEVRKALGEPTEIDHPDYSAQFNGIQFEERWAYIYRRGIPLIYSEGCVKFFFFNEGKVIAVDVH